MKKTFLFILLFSVLFQCADASDNDTSSLSLTNVLNRLNEVQLDLQGQTVKATVIEKNNAQTQQFNLTMAFLKWGYIAQQTINDKTAITSGMLLDNWAMRSNDFSQDIGTYANSSSISIDLKGRSLDVKVHSVFLPSFVFAPLTVYDLNNLLAKMENLKITQTTNLFIVDGDENIQNGNWSVKETFHIVFDPAHKMFPVEGDIYMQGKLLNKWSGIYSYPNANGYFPQVFSTEIFNNNMVILSTLYTNITVADQITEANNLIEAGHIAKGSVVNDYRFSRPFAYIQGSRNPTPEELLAMSTNNAAIIEYQKSSSLVAPFSYTSAQQKGRWVVIAFLVVSTVFGCVFLLSGRQKK